MLLALFFFLEALLHLLEATFVLGDVKAGPHIILGVCIRVLKLC